MKNATVLALLVATAAAEVSSGECIDLGSDIVKASHYINGGKFYFNVWMYLDRGAMPELNGPSTGMWVGSNFGPSGSVDGWSCTWNVDGGQTKPACHDYWIAANNTVPMDSDRDDKMGGTNDYSTIND